MKTEKRWIKNVIKEAEKCDVQLPWARGKRRTAMITRRTGLSARAQA